MYSFKPIFRSLNVLVACERYGIVRDAFLAQGHNAFSCDIAASADGSNRHIQDDVRNHLTSEWDCLIVAHPPCTRLCNSGVRWLHKPPKRRQEGYPAAYDDWSEAQQLEWMWEELERGAALFSDLWNADIPHVAVENPIMHYHAKERIENYQDPAQIAQPWWFGDPVFKGTGLYLRRLPKLKPTNKLTPPEKGTEEHKEWSKIHRMGPSKNRGNERSKFFKGFADAMAEQWSRFILEARYA